MSYVINIQDSTDMAAHCHISNGSTFSTSVKNGSNHGRHTQSSDSGLGIWEIINPYFLHQWMPYFFFGEVVFMYSVGCFFALPRLYPETVHIHQVIGTFFLYEIVVNWWFIHRTDSSFKVSEYPKEKLATGSYPFKVWLYYFLYVWYIWYSLKFYWKNNQTIKQKCVRSENTYSIPVHVVYSGRLYN